MRIISWNVNGLRALHRKGKWNEILDLDPDILCLQEIKAEVKDLPAEVQSPLNFYSYFDSPKEKKGYSGVAMYSKVKTEGVSYDFHGDKEGRLIEAHFKDFILFNVYFPNGGGGPERLKYKLEFYEKFLKFIEKHRNPPTGGKPIIFCGDINTAHKEIDLARPKENETRTGFLPEERVWIDKVVKKGYVDIFRHLNPDRSGAYTYWDMKTFARDRNVGWRIDYFFISPELLSKVKKVEILDDIFGSDHCPISLELN
ncbi:MAG TPA: exodeoxyribonuclease III [Candidatus Paceibacterota bacterium]